jgi:hypothetical protein
MTRIEEFLFVENRHHFVKQFSFADSIVTIRLVPVERYAEADSYDEPTATFTSATVPEMSKFDATEPDEWPLDIIGFDCDQNGDRWKFSLTCDTIEWAWESDWPTRT